MTEEKEGLVMNTQSHLRTWFPAAAFATLLTAMLSTNVAAQDIVTFKDDVLPIIEVRCQSCHQPGGPGYEASGLDMRTYEGLIKGTKHGSVITPGRPFESSLIAMIDHRTDPEIWMPHDRKRLSKCERLVFRFWVAQGAKNN
jgi:Planctomycete cytochrome C